MVVVGDGGDSVMVVGNSSDGDEHSISIPAIFSQIRHIDHKHHKHHNIANIIHIKHMHHTQIPNPQTQTSIPQIQSSI